MITNAPRRAWKMLISGIALLLITLACGNVPTQPDTGATVQAFYATITAQAGGTNPVLPTQPATTTTAVPAITAQGPTRTPQISPTPPETRSGNGVNFTLPRCEHTITVDGVDTEWAEKTEAPSLPMTEPTFGEEEWRDVNDLSGTARLCWTDTALYLVVNVKDDVHVQTETNFRSWRGDEVEVLVDTDLRGDFFDDAMSADDTHLGLNSGNFDSIQPHGVKYEPDLIEAPSIQLVVRRAINNGGNYTLEAAIPWAIIGIAPATGVSYGMCVAISDNDHTEVGQQDSMVSHCTDLLTRDPSTWVTARLE